MRSGFVCVVLGSLVLTAGSLPAQGRRGEEQGGRFGWLGSLEQGKAEARRTGKPIMVAVRCVP